MKTLRLAKDWTLADLAKHSGGALSSLSRIEPGRMTGTLESHIKVSRALGVRLPELYADLDPSGAALEHRQGVPADRFLNGKGASFSILTSGGLRKKMLPVLIHLQPGKSSQREQAPAGAEKFLYLLKGKLEVTAGSEKVPMNEGDSLYLQASHPHSLRNIGAGNALALSVVSPPSV